MYLSLLVALPGAVCVRADSVSAALDAGWENYRLSEFDRASRFFEQAMTLATNAPTLRARAQYGLGVTWSLRRPGEDRVKAERYYQQVLKEKADPDVTAWTALALARLQHLVPVGAEPDMPAVRLAYDAVIRDYPGHLAAKEAFIYKMSTFIASLEEVETRYAVAALRKFVSEPGAKEFLQPAWSLMAVGYTTLNQQADRLHAEIMSLQTTESDPSNPFTEFAWAYWNIATIAEFELGDFEQARRYYRRLIDEYPRDIRVYGARQALERMDHVEAGLRTVTVKPDQVKP